MQREKMDITKHVFYQPTASYRPPPNGGPAVEPKAKNMLCSAADLSAKLLSVYASIPVLLSVYCLMIELTSLVEEMLCD